jgi:hypothetical protein
MAGHLDMIDIIHRRPPNPLVVPGEAERLDEVNGDPHAGSEPHYGADIAGDFRLKKAKPHAVAIVRTRPVAQAGQFDHLHMRGETLSGAPTEPAQPERARFVPFGTRAKFRS